MSQTSVLAERYAIVETLGSGGFGDTFLAQDTQMPSGRKVVVKRLRPIANNAKLDHSIKERFHKEAAILEDLGKHHPQIPELYAYFSQHGYYYLVQEYIEGKTLGNLGKISPQTARQLLGQLLPVLSYIHSKKIIHRDIKPDNIIVRASDHIPVLIDFGAVRETMGTVMSSSGSCVSSVVIGTPGFMPPEQSAGRPVFSSDLYALAMTMIYALTGRYPAELESDPVTGQLLWCSYAPGIESSLAHILDRAIQPIPQSRFPSAQAMLDALLVNSEVKTAIAASPAAKLANQTLSRSPVKAQKRSPQPNKAAPSVFFSIVLMGSLGLAAGVGVGSVWFNQYLNEQRDQQSAAMDQAMAQAQAEAERARQEIDQAQAEAERAQAEAEQERRLQASANSQESPPASASQPKVTTPPLFQNESSPTPTSEAGSETEALARAREEQRPPREETPTPKPEPDILEPASPEQAIVDYYATINSRQYEAAWGKLSKAFQRDRAVHPSGYSSYVGWWEQVEAVDVQTANLVEQNSDKATVELRLRYAMKNGTRAWQSYRFVLLWDAREGQWKIQRQIRR